MTNAVLRRVLAAAATAALFGIARPSCADDESSPKKGEVEAQMRKIVQLMRENEQALLDASRGDAAAPKRVDVVPPAERTPPAKAGDLPPAAPQGETSKGESAGNGASRGMDELLGGASKRGDTVRREIEKLLRMIPH